MSSTLIVPMAAEGEAVQFLKRLRGPIKKGEVTCTIRIWQQPRVREGRAYRMEDGFVVVDRIRQIGLDEITPDLARRSGFLGVVDLLKVARHGSGENVYLVDFHYQTGD